MQRGGKAIDAAQVTFDRALRARSWHVPCFGSQHDVRVIRGGMVVPDGKRNAGTLPTAPSERGTHDIGPCDSLADILAETNAEPLFNQWRSRCFS